MEQFLKEILETHAKVHFNLVTEIVRAVFELYEAEYPKPSSSGEHNFNRLKAQKNPHCFINTGDPGIIKLIQYLNSLELPDTKLLVAKPPSILQVSAIIITIVEQLDQRGIIGDYIAGSRIITEAVNEALTLPSNNPRRVTIIGKIFDLFVKLYKEHTELESKIRILLFSRAESNRYKPTSKNTINEIVFANAPPPIEMRRGFRQPQIRNPFENAPVEWVVHRDLHDQAPNVLRDEFGD